MFKAVILLTRKDGMSRAEFRHWMLEEHSPLAKQLPGLRKLVFNIVENEKYNVESIVIEGNTKTKSTVVLRELVLGPGDVFDTVRMKISKLRLENTRFFDDVSVTPQETNIPGRRTMRIAASSRILLPDERRSSIFSTVPFERIDTINSRLP